MRAIVVMGVAGCGKSTVAGAVCERTGARLIEGDVFHPASNVAKMAAGMPLTDADRQGWLEQLAGELAAAWAANERVVLTCSALKQRYRDTLRAAVPRLGFVYLSLSPEAATARVGSRQGHFMPATLVESQFRDLEPPIGEPDVLVVDATDALPRIAEDVDAWWRN